MKRIAIVTALLLTGATALSAQSTPLKPELRPFAGANIPTGPQRDLFGDAAMIGAQVALEIKPSLHVVGTFGWVASQTQYVVSDNDVNMFTYDVGLELGAVAPIGGNWEFKPFVGIGGGARTYAYQGTLPDKTCASVYAALGTEFQIAPWAFRLEGRYNAFGYLSPLAGVDKETRGDVGLSLGLAYHFR
jgi:outer membrane protein with beta-barrel domain